MKIGIVGASGFTGAELLRICATHPDFEVVMATGASKVGTPLADLYPSLRPVYGDLAYTPFEPEEAAGLDLVFLGLPHGASADAAMALKGKVGHIVDLSADFRLHDPALYPQWYNATHQYPEMLQEFVYGLPEFNREQLKGAPLIAAPGCYVTTSALPLAALLKADLIEPTGIIVDAASGVSGAGRAPKDNTTFCAADEDFTAYGLLNHRHTPEIEQAIGEHAGVETQVLFTPHLAPMNRGILATCYARPTGNTSTQEVLDALHAAYDHEPFVTVSEASPHTKAALGSNSAHLTARFDERTGWVMAIGAIDNLVKGASGQAVQCANLALGIDESTGLTQIGLFP